MDRFAIIQPVLQLLGPGEQVVRQVVGHTLETVHPQRQFAVDIAGDVVGCRQLLLEQHRLHFIVENAGNEEGGQADADQKQQAGHGSNASSQTAAEARPHGVRL